jgi:hypothetical protein
MPIILQRLRDGKHLGYKLELRKTRREDVVSIWTSAADEHGGSTKAGEGADFEA